MIDHVADQRPGLTEVVIILAQRVGGTDHLAICGPVHFGRAGGIGLWAAASCHRWALGRPHPSSSRAVSSEAFWLIVIATYSGPGRRNRQHRRFGRAQNGVASRPVPKVEVRNHVKLPASHGPRYSTRRGTAVW